MNDIFLKLVSKSKSFFNYQKNLIFDENDVISEYVINEGSLEIIDEKLLKKCFWICHEQFQTNDLRIENLTDSSLENIKEYNADSHKQCKICQNVLYGNEFTIYFSTKLKRKIEYPYCKNCVRCKNKKRYENPKYALKIKTKSSEYRKNENYQSNYRIYKKNWYNEVKNNSDFKEKRNNYQRMYRLQKKNVC
jgi:Pyruvate/2-oxoacid:ferredoxin oxidoreductase delta subunit